MQFFTDVSPYIRGLLIQISFSVPQIHTFLFATNFNLMVLAGFLVLWRFIANEVLLTEIRENLIESHLEVLRVLEG